MMRLLVGIGFLIGFLIAPSSWADAPGPFGAGFILGAPTGLSLNYRKSAERSIDGALAWNFGSDTGMEIHSDYLWHRPDILRASGISVMYGIGGRFFFVNARDRESAKTKIGPRLPIGLETNFNQKAIEAFVEVALVLNVVPATTSDFDFGIGARVYF